METVLLETAIFEKLVYVILFFFIIFQMIRAYVLQDVSENQGEAQRKPKIPGLHS